MTIIILKYSVQVSILNIFSSILLRLWDSVHPHTLLAAILLEAILCEVLRLHTSAQFGNFLVHFRSLLFHFPYRFTLPTHLFVCHGLQLMDTAAITATVTDFPSIGCVASTTVVRVLPIIAP